MSNQLKAHLALFTTGVIYGLNYTIAKGVMPDFIQPFGFIFLRVSGALFLFWAIHLFTPRDRIAWKHFPRLAACGLFGVAINQLLFFKGLNITTPINASIIMTSNPILVLIASAFILGEKITRLKVLGIILGLMGALAIILSKGQDHFSSSFSHLFESKTAFGDLLVLINAASYGVYLVIVKPLMKIYQPLTVIKWVFLFGFCIVAPVGFDEFSQIDWASMPGEIYGAVIFVVIGTTFLAYLFNIYALKQVSPSVASIYIYLQPVLAAFFALWLGKDSLTWIKVVSALLIFAGIFMVSRPVRSSA